MKKYRKIAILALVLAAALTAGSVTGALASEGEVKARGPESSGASAVLHTNELTYYRALERASAENRRLVACRTYVPKDSDAVPRALEAFGGDHPEEMRLDGTVTWSLPLVDFTVIYLRYGDQVTEEQETEAKEAARRLCEGLRDLSPEEQVKELYTRLTQSVTYRAEEEEDFTMYGALVNGRACCDGISKAFAWCLTELGVENYTIAGMMPSGSGHRWNAVKLEGRWYQLDPTWDLELPEENWHYYLVEEAHPDAELFLPAI